MKKLSALLLSITAFLFIFNGCDIDAMNTPEEVEEKRETTLNIMTTNKLLYKMVKDIVKDKHNVEFMFTEDIEAWNFKYTDDSINNISKKDLFIYMGANYEPWINNFLSEVKKSKVGIINASRGVTFINLTIGKSYEEREIKENPYYFYNIDNYKISLSNIKTALQDKDPKNRDFYENNFKEILENIQNLEKDIKELKDGFKGYAAVLPDDELDYLIQYLGFDTFKLETIFSQEGSIEDFDKLIKDKDNKIIFFYNNKGKKELYEALLERYSMDTIYYKGKDINLTYIEILEDLKGQLEKIQEEHSSGS